MAQNVVVWVFTGPEALNKKKRGLRLFLTINMIRDKRRHLKEVLK